jgi:hypothetical protein
MSDIQIFRVWSFYGMALFPNLHEKNGRIKTFVRSLLPTSAPSGLLRPRHLRRNNYVTECSIKF